MSSLIRSRVKFYIGIRTVARNRAESNERNLFFLLENNLELHDLLAVIQLRSLFNVRMSLQSAYSNKSNRWSSSNTKVSFQKGALTQDILCAQRENKRLDHAILLSSFSPHTSIGNGRSPDNYWRSRSELSIASTLDLFFHYQRRSLRKLLSQLGALSSTGSVSKDRVGGGYGEMRERKCLAGPQCRCHLRECFWKGLVDRSPYNGEPDSREPQYRKTTGKQGLPGIPDAVPSCHTGDE